MSSKKQQSQVTQFTRMANFCKNIPANVTINELNQRLNSTKQLFAEFKANQDDIEEKCGEDNREFQYTTRGQIEDLFYFCSAKLAEGVDYLKNVQQQANQNQNAGGNNGNRGNHQQEVKLPQNVGPVVLY